jgi:hypothetical protein
MGVGVERLLELDRIELAAEEAILLSQDLVLDPGVGRPVVIDGDGASGNLDRSVLVGPV